MNYHTILGVSNTATKQQIKKAFISLAKIYHPDSSVGNGLTEKENLERTYKFRQIHEAYRVLSKKKTVQHTIKYTNTRMTPQYESYINKRDYDIDEWERGHGLGKYANLSDDITKNVKITKTETIKLNKTESYFHRRNLGLPRNPWKNI